ncbi:MAG: hypothetical protein A4E69_00313 [Syntrophus sp. PtaB.Bin138]|nr:MAG: hypothetical protein A4E69_00313 [Syntrophus sp. PtaB.Bin138]
MWLLFIRIGKNHISLVVQDVDLAGGSKFLHVEICGVFLLDEIHIAEDGTFADFADHAVFQGHIALVVDIRNGEFFPGDDKAVAFHQVVDVEGFVRDGLEALSCPVGGCGNLSGNASLLSGGDDGVVDLLLTGGQGNILLLLDQDAAGIRLGNGHPGLIDIGQPAHAGGKAGVTVGQIVIFD